MQIMDEKLGNEFNEEEAKRIIKIALLCTNASPVLRPTMSEVVSMLEGNTVVEELISDPGIFGDEYGNDLRFKPLKAYHQQVQKKNNEAEKQGKNSTSDALQTEPSTSTSAHDLYQINPESLTISGQDLYQINTESMTISDSSTFMSHHSP